MTETYQKTISKDLDPNLIREISPLLKNKSSYDDFMNLSKALFMNKYKVSHTVYENIINSLRKFSRNKDLQKEYLEKMVYDKKYKENEGLIAEIESFKPSFIDGFDYELFNKKFRELVDKLNTDNIDLVSKGFIRYKLRRPYILTEAEWNNLFKEILGVDIKYPDNSVFINELSDYLKSENIDIDEFKKSLGYSKHKGVIKWFENPKDLMKESTYQLLMEAVDKYTASKHQEKEKAKAEPEEKIEKTEKIEEINVANSNYSKLNEANRKLADEYIDNLLRKQKDEEIIKDIKDIMAKYGISKDDLLKKL